MRVEYLVKLIISIMVLRYVLLERSLCFALIYMAQGTRKHQLGWTLPRASHRLPRIAAHHVTAPRLHLPILGLILGCGQVVRALEVHQNVAVTMLHLGVTHGAEEILRVDLTVSVLRLQSVETDGVR